MLNLLQCEDIDITIVASCISMWISEIKFQLNYTTSPLFKRAQTSHVHVDVSTIQMEAQGLPRAPTDLSTWSENPIHFSKAVHIVVKSLLAEIHREDKRHHILQTLYQVIHQLI